MELKVWVEGTQRIVCGVTESTSCQDVVYALAHATCQTGRFILVEKWRSNERILSPSDKPLKVLLKWGEYSGDVQFLLRRSTGSNEGQQQKKDSSKTPYFSPQPPRLPNSRESSKSPTQISNKDIKKSLTFSGGRSGASTPNDLLESSPSSRADVTPSNSSPVVSRSDPPFRKDQRSRTDLPKGVVRGVPQQKQTSSDVDRANDVKYRKDSENVISRPVKKIGPPPEYRIPPPCQKTSPALNDSSQTNLQSNKSRTSINNANQTNVVTPSKVSRTQSPQPPVPAADISSPSILVNSHHHHHHNQPTNDLSIKTNNNGYSHSKDRTKDAIIPASFPASINKKDNFNCQPQHRQPPPYPPERTLASQDKIIRRQQNDAKYNDLFRIVHIQREKLLNQQDDIRKYDSEIRFWDEKNKDHEHQVQLLEQEIKRLDFSEREQAELIVQLDLTQFDKAYEKGKLDEESMTREINLIRSDIGSCEKELEDRINNTKCLKKNVEHETKIFREEENRSKNEEVEILRQIDELRDEIDCRTVEYEDTKCTECVENDLNKLDAALSSKRKELDGLVADMKAVNLESLAMGSNDDVKEGTNHSRCGSARKMKGSPRELENAVPTNNNPHGVWV